VVKKLEKKIQHYFLNVAMAKHTLGMLMRMLEEAKLTAYPHQIDYTPYKHMLSFN